MTGKQREALAMLQRARDTDPNTDDGIVTYEATFYDREVAVAWIHWRTADALERQGLIRTSYDPDGSPITLVSG